jgi:hypothetical protein
MSNDFYLWIHHKKGDDCIFGTKNGFRKSAELVVAKRIEGVHLFLVSCYDLYEDGYCVFATKDGIDDSSPDFGSYLKFEIIADIQFRGNSEYPSKYPNRYAGEETFNGISSLSDFEKLKENRYFFIVN